MRVGREQWPLKGRDDLVATLLTRLESSSIALFGEPGVGKTRIASEVASRLAAEGRKVERVLATDASRRVSFGAFSRLVPMMPASDLLVTLEHTARAISARAEGSGLLIVVDDAHHLDEPSLALLQRLLVEEGLRLVITARADASSEEITDLWKDGLAERFDVGPLDRTAQDEIVFQVFPTHPDGRLLDRLWDLALGRPLFLRELIHAGDSSGAIRVDADGAHLVGELQPSDRLIDIIEARLAALPDDQRAVLEAIALAEPVPIHIVSRLAGSQSLARLERERVLRTTVLGGNEVIRLHHPMYGEVLRSQMSIAHRRNLTQKVVSAVDDEDMRAPGAALTMASWLLDLGERPEHNVAVKAAREALGRSDPDLARRLARIASEQETSVEALVALGRASSVQGDASAEETFRVALETARDDHERVEAGLALARHLVWVERKIEEGSELLSAMLEDVSAGGRRAQLRVELASYSAVKGDMALAREIADDAASDPSSDQPTQLEGLIWSTLASSMLGRFKGIEPKLGRGERLAGELHATVPLALDQLQINRAMYRRFVDVRQALATVGEGLEQSTSRRGPTGLWHVMSAWMHLPMGNIGQALLSAERGIRDAQVFDPFNNLAMARCVRCIGLALGGSPALARKRLAAEEADRLEPRTRTWFDQAEVWSIANGGDTETAAERALEAARRARDGGLTVWSCELAFIAVRLGSSETAADLVGDLYHEMTDAPIPELFVKGAEASAFRSPSDMAELARCLEALGETAAAIDMLAIASARSSGQQANRFAVEAMTLLHRSGDLHTPAIQELEDPLSPRERQVAVLAGGGLTSRAIADQLYLGVRTVDNHLSRVYRKLGLGGKDELGPVFLLGAEDASVSAFFAQETPI